MKILLHQKSTDRALQKLERMAGRLLHARKDPMIRNQSKRGGNYTPCFHLRRKRLPRRRRSPQLTLFWLSSYTLLHSPPTLLSSQSVSVLKIKYRILDLIMVYSWTWRLLPLLDGGGFPSLALSFAQAWDGAWNDQGLSPI